MIMSLLLITFELLQGNMDGADSLMTTSIHLLKGSLTQYRQDDLTSQKDPRRIIKAEDDVADIEHMLPFLSITGAWTPFLKTQLTNLALWDTTPGSRPSTLLPSSSSQKLKLDINQIQREWSRFFSRASAFTGRAFTTIMQTHPPTVPDSLVTDQQTYLSHLEEWKTILATALSHSVDTKTNHSVRLMQLHRLTLRIGITCSLDSTDTAWDLYDADFQAVVDVVLSLALAAGTGSDSDTTASSTTTTTTLSSNPIPNKKKVMKKPNKKYHANFTLNMGILSALGPAIAKCRNHNIRMRALEIARRMPWREGSWDAEAELYGKLGAVLLEERGRVGSGDGVVRAEDRWTWVQGSWNLERGKMEGVYARSVRDDDGGVAIQRLEMGLDGWVDVCKEVGCRVDHAYGLDVLV